MKRTIIILVVVVALASLNVCATQMERRVLYCYSQTISTNVPDISMLVELTDDSDGGPVRFTWLVQGFTPTETTLLSYDSDIVDAWWNAKRLDEEVDYNKWSDRERRMFKLLIKEINKLRVKNGDSPYTKAQIVNALKAK